LGVCKEEKGNFLPEDAKKVPSWGKPAYLAELLLCAIIKTGNKRGICGEKDADNRRFRLFGKQSSKVLREGL
jgi:hypothetical protein